MKKSLLNLITNATLHKVLILITLVLSACCLQSCTSSRSSSYEYSDDDYSYSYSYSAPSDSNSSLKSSQKRQADNLEKNLEATGQVVFRSGYTFDSCVEVARKYMKSKYGAEFYDTSVVVSTEDLQAYFVVGYSKTGKAFEVCIYHGTSSWEFVTAIY